MPDHGFGVCVIPQDQNRTGLRVPSPLDAHDHAIFNFWLLAQCDFQITRVDVSSTRRHDDFFLSTLEIQVALGVERTYVARAVPALIIRNTLPPVAPISRSNASTFDQNLAVFREFHFAARGSTFPIDPLPRRNGSFTLISEVLSVVHTLG